MIAQQKQNNNAWEAIMEDGDYACARGNYRDAELFYKAALAMAFRGKATVHSAVAKVLSQLAELYIDQHKYPLSEAFLRQALGVLEAAEGNNHIDRAIILKRLSEICRAQSKDLEAIEYKRRADEALAVPIEQIKNCFKKRFYGGMDLGQPGYSCR